MVQIDIMTSVFVWQEFQIETEVNSLMIWNSRYHNNLRNPENKIKDLGVFMERHAVQGDNHLLATYICSVLIYFQTI